jgi:3-oxoacyl-[acyl-carrier protein] reductase
LPPVIAPPKFAGIQSDIATPNSSGAVSTLLEALTTHFAGKLDTVVFNAAVMTLANMGEGSVRADAVGFALAGNVRFSGDGGAFSAGGCV